MALKQARAVGDETVVQPDQAELDSMNGGGAAVARVNTAAVALGGFAGETEDIQMKLPFLQVASGMGKLDCFVKGSVVIGGENLIAGPGEPVLITILSAQSFWKEYVAADVWSADTIPATYATKAGVLAAGGTTEWVNGKAPTFKLAGILRVLVAKPDRVEGGIFGVPIGGVMHAPAQFGVDKSAAQEVLPVIKRDKAFALRERGLYAGVYELRTRAIKFANGHTAWVPAIKLVSYHTDAEISEIKSLFAGVAQTPGQEEPSVDVKM